MAYLFSDICASHINAYSVYSATVVFACLAEQPLKAPQYAIPRGGPVGSEYVQKRGEHALCTRPGHNRRLVSVVDSLVSDSVPQFMDVLSTLKSAQLSSGDGQLNLQPILEAQKNIATANQSLQQQVQKYQQLPKAHIGMVKNAYATGNTQLTKMADKVNQLSGTFQILPDFLGSDQPRTYALMAMTTSEERSSGGLIGSVGVVTTDNGKISIGDFRSDGEYIPYGAGDPTEDEQRIFRQWGPLNMSFDVRDLAVYPDTSRSAEGMRAIWQRTPWGSNTQLDGVLMVDPVFLQELTKISGNVTIPDGTVLTGDNTAEFLLNKVYVDCPVSMQDALFAQVAEQTVGSMFSNIDLAKLTKVAQLMGSMAEGRHFSMYAFDETAEKPLVMQALPRRRQAARKTRRWECM
nr:DUF4012 domain-containing protein [Bifidobacterium longum]